ncbi:MAG: hypothetical protein A2Y15_03115 [Clostridiales bacterium GWF2_36_10]|nr:MAG: hypothetical protein A2Y15_03115 [Clostridiales bacterium GWF2_36_10]HAN20963.1 hypothetical protein [Clostridiales bacterium]
MTPLNYILWAFVIGIGIGTIYTFYTKLVLGKLVRKLIEIDACSPETAISLEKLGYKMNKMVEIELRKGKSYSETVVIDKDGNYFINPGQLKKAKIKYRNEGTSLFLLLVILCILSIVAVFSTYVFPEVIEKIDEFIKELIG